MSDDIIKINVTKMEDYLNRLYSTKCSPSNPIDEQNYHNTMRNVFDILKQFEEKDSKEFRKLGK